MKPLIRPLAYEVIHREADGRRKSVRVFSRGTADRLFDEQLAAGQVPTLYLGGLVLRGAETNSSQTRAEAKPTPSLRRPRCRCHENPPTGKCLPCIEELVAA